MLRGASSGHCRRPHSSSAWRTSLARAACGLLPAPPTGRDRTPRAPARRVAPPHPGPPLPSPFSLPAVLPPGIGDDAAFAERFAREAKAMAKLSHPGIVTIHDFGQADGLCYFVTELVDGVNLRQTLYLLRQLLPDDDGPPFLLATRQTVQVNPDAASTVRPSAIAATYIPALVLTGHAVRQGMFSS